MWSIKISKQRFQPIIFMALLILMPVSELQAQTLKIATISPDGTMWMKKMREGVSEISKRTEGRVKIKFYPGGVMGNDQSVLRKMRIGQLQGGVFTVGSLSKIYPDIQIYGLPFLFASQAEVDEVREKMDPLLLEELEKKGLIGFDFAGGGFAYNMSTEPQQSLEDLIKRKVWVPAGDAISRAVMKAAGVTPIPLPISDVLTGLQTGMIDTVAVTPVGAIAFQWYTKVNYLMNAPISYVYGLVAIDKKAFKKLRAVDQKIVRDVMNRVYKDIDQQNRLDNQKAKEALKNQGVHFVDLSPELMQKWRNVARKATEILGAEGAFSPEMLNQLRNNLKHVRSTETQPLE